MSGICREIQKVAIFFRVVGSDLCCAGRIRAACTGAVAARGCPRGAERTACGQRGEPLERVIRYVLDGGPMLKCSGNTSPSIAPNLFKTVLETLPGGCLDRENVSKDFRATSKDARERPSARKARGQGGKSASQARTHFACPRNPFRCLLAGKCIRPCADRGCPPSRKTVGGIVQITCHGRVFAEPLNPLRVNEG